VRFLKAERGRFHFQFATAEKRALLALLARYPLTPENYQALGRDARTEDQELLQVALAEHRRENKQRAALLRKTRTRFHAHRHGWRISFRPAEVEWLLQVLNDIRVGSWLRLGSPDKLDDVLLELTDKNAPDFWTMHLSGAFQVVLLRAMGKSHAA